MPYLAVVRMDKAGQKTVKNQYPKPRGVTGPKSGTLYVSAPIRGLERKR